MVRDVRVDTTRSGWAPFGHQGCVLPCWGLWSGIVAAVWPRGRFLVTKILFFRVGDPGGSRVVVFVRRGPVSVGGLGAFASAGSLVIAEWPRLCWEGARSTVPILMLPDGPARIPGQELATGKMGEGEPAAGYVRGAEYRLAR